MNRFLIIILTLCYLHSDGQISIANNYNPGGPGGARRAIIVSGNQTGDDLRTFIINANPNVGTVDDRNITFDAELVIDSDATFTDYNATYHFPENFRYSPRLNSIVTFTDLTIHYSGSQKTHTYNQPYTANFTRVFFIQGSEGTRSDFFNNGDYTFNMNGVTFVSYGNNDFIHFQSNTTLNDITITNSQGGLNFEPGANIDGDVQVINNLKLEGINRIVGGRDAQGDFRAVNMEWLVDDWIFSPRDVDFVFVNPIKSPSWQGYIFQQNGGNGNGNNLSVKELYTHDVTVTDRDLNPLSGVNVFLYNNNEETFDYSAITDAEGKVPRQEVLKIDNTVSLNHDRGISVLLVPDYFTRFFSVARDFTSPIVDNIVIEEDEFITEMNSNIVASYSGINIDHNNRIITISENTTLCELYDFVKLDKVNNITQPSLLEFLATPSKNILDISDYQMVLTPNAILSPCDNFVKIESSATSTIPVFENLHVGIEDATQSFKYIQISNLINANIVIEDRSSTPSANFLELNNFTGVSSSVTQFDSDNVSIVVTRDGYTTWALEQDFSSDQDIYFFVARQSPLLNPATSEKQDEIIFLAKKILMKSQGIVQQLNHNPTTLSIDNLTQQATLQATKERQLEILDLLKRSLAKTTASRNSF